MVVRPKRSMIKATERPPATAHSASLTTNVRVTGNRMSSAFGDAKVKGVPRRLTAFVSRLHKDTTEDDLCDMLQSAGIFDVKCTSFPRQHFVYLCQRLSAMLFIILIYGHVELSCVTGFFTLPPDPSALRILLNYYVCHLTSFI